MAAHFRNASWSGIAAAIRAAFGLVNVLLAARLLGVEQYGYVATLLSVFVLYLTLNSGVFTALVVKLMSTVDTETQDLLRASAALFSVMSIAVLVMMTLALNPFATRIMPVEPGTLKVGHVVMLMGVLTATQILAARYSALIESAGRLDIAMKRQLVGPTVVLVTLAVFFFEKGSISASSYLLTLSAGALTDLGLLWLANRKLGFIPLPGGSIRQRMQGLVTLLKSGGLLQASSLMGMFLEPLNKLLLNHFVGAASVTVYDLAMKVIWGIQHLFSAAMRVFLHLGSQDEEAIWPAFSRVIALIGIPVMLLHVVGALFLSWVAHHWLMIEARELMLFFAVATLSNLGMVYIMPLYISLIGRGELLFIFRSQVILATTNILVSLALIPYIGLIGAAFGLLSATMYNVVAIYGRCKAYPSTFKRVAKVPPARQITYAVTALLFFAAIILGLKGGDSVMGVLALLLILAVITIREPIVGVLLARIRLKL